MRPFLQWLVGNPAPAKASPPALPAPAPRDSSPGVSASVSVPFRGQFEATRISPDRTPLPAGIGTSFRRVLGAKWSESAEREVVAGMARYIVDNYGAAFYAVDLLANYSVPIIPRAATADRDWNAAAEAYFDAWAERGDFTRRHTFSSVQRILSIAIDTDGDVGASVEMDGDAGPVLRVWPAWRIGSNIPKSTDQNPDGVVVDEEGRVIGYEVIVSPGINPVTKRLGFDQMILLTEEDRMERCRGVSALRRGMNDLRDANDIKAFEKLATKIESAMAAVIEGVTPEEDWEPVSGAGGEGEDANPAPPTAIGEASASVTMAQLLGGEIPTLPDGQSLKQLSSTRPGTNKIDFLDTLAGYFVSGLGLPPAFFLDTKLTGPNQRAVLGKAQRRFNRRKAVMARFAVWIWRRVIAYGIESGELDAVDGWEKATVQEPAIATIDLGDQLAADHEALGKGFLSRQRFHGAGGRDWEREEEQVFAEDDEIIARCSEQSKRTGVPLEALLARHGFPEAKPAPAPAPGGSSGGGGGGKPAPKQDLAESAESGEPDVEGYSPRQRRDYHGRFDDGGGSTGGKDKAKSDRAKATHKTSTKGIQRRAEAEQAIIAKHLRGENDFNNKAFDVRKGRHAIEVKTVIRNKNDKLTMHPSSRRRKEAFAAEHGLKSHTIAIDIRGIVKVKGERVVDTGGGKKRYLYAEGVGAFRLGKMREVTLAELRRILK